MEEKNTKPTIETVLERMIAMEERLNGRMTAMELGINQRISKLEERLDSRLDRIESLGNITRGQMLELRADFRDLRSQLRGQLPAIN